MNKAQLIAKIATDTQIAPQEVTHMLDSFMAIMHTELQAGNTITLRGFGTFSSKFTAAKKGFNFHNGSTIDIAAKRKFTWKPSSSYK